MDSLLFILRLLFIILIYLFLMQVVLAIRRDLRSTEMSRFGPDSNGNAPPVFGHLVVINSGPSNIQPGTRYPLSPKTNIGRGPANTIQIVDTTVSAENTRMWFQNGVWYVQDAGSANGTYVNNQPAREAVSAKVGDIVQVGSILFQIKP
jgi:hypothetical protein